MMKRSFLPLFAVLALAPGCITAIGGSVGYVVSTCSTPAERRQNVITGIVLGAFIDAVAIAAISTIDVSSGPLLDPGD